MRDNAAFRKVQYAIAHLSEPAPPSREILGYGKIALYLQSFMQGLAERRNACLIRVEAIESAFASLDEAALLVTERGLIRRMSSWSEKLLRDTVSDKPQCVMGIGLCRTLVER
jgi:hypothetical protein